MSAVISDCGKYHCTKCGFSPGQRTGDMGCEHETTVAQIAPVATIPTQQQFDLSSFRKEVEGRLKQKQPEYAHASIAGCTEVECCLEGEIEALEWVLALLPGEED